MPRKPPAPRHAALTLPPQPAPRRGFTGAERVGAAALCAGLLALGVLAALRLREQPRGTPSRRQRGHARAARYLNGGAAILSFSVLADSGLEHYRGAFVNPAMYVAPTVAAASLANSLHMTLTPERFGVARRGLCGLALATGIAGTGFHVYNLAKREGGIGLLNLFYGAPLGAPFAIALAGLAGLAAARLVAENDEGAEAASLLDLPAGPLLAFGAAGGLMGTAAEAALLHFRGAFHDPFMYLPVTVPPLAALALAAAALRQERRGIARLLLRATAFLGLAGAGFHLYGMQRNMGGFANWSQNLLQGPPLPAPPSFTGIAIAGIAALELMEEK